MRCIVIYFDFLYIQAKKHLFNSLIKGLVKVSLVFVKKNKLNTRPNFNSNKETKKVQHYDSVQRSQTDFCHFDGRAVIHWCLLLYDKNFENQENFMNLVLKIEKLLWLWRIRNLSLASKSNVFKTLTISKIVHLALVKIIPNS